MPQEPPIDPAVTAGWYLPTLPTIPAVALEVFKKHTNLPDDEVLPHIIAVREKAWKVFPYPCIGAFRFLDFSISESAIYPSIVTRLQSGQSLLDLGCCFGQDIRKLVSDGAPSENITGADLVPEFIELGYDLFLDRGSLKTTFVTPVDILAGPDTEPMKSLQGKFDIVHIASFLHLFGYEDQVKAAKNLVRFLKPGKGSMVVGRQAGNVKGGERVHRTNAKKSMFVHDQDTFERFWGEDVGGEWELEASFQKIEVRREGSGEPKEPALLGEGARWLRFVVSRA